MTSPAPQPSTRARVLRWLLAIITIGLLVRLGARVAWSDVWATAVRASPAWLLVAALVNLATPAVRGIRWWVFLRAVGSPSVPLAVHAAYVGSGLNNLLPASGGDPARALLVARRSSIPSATALATLTVDRLVEIATYLVLLLAAPLVLSVPPPLRHAQTVSGLILGALMIAAFLATRMARDRSPLASGRGRIGSFMARFVTGVAELPTARRVVPAMLLSLVAWGLQGATYHLTAVATGLPVSFGASVVAMLAVNLSFLFPLTPGNVGVFQVVYAVTLGAYGISSDAAVATALLLQAVQILPMTALALVLAPDLLFRRARAGAP
ncbi:MAG TPA: lysylphosphatidylglycerol synthase transmembrane domain-containing protein [Gemmatimonadaceae bacterium]|nr:lysylphosphatidylglycerol synthase transmembrane domain-containing protein [Gemmatimonadaceae bacterium]